MGKDIQTESDNLQVFKTILEYFVKHMNYICSQRNQENEKGKQIYGSGHNFEETYTKDNFMGRGQGYAGNKIQEQMEAYVNNALHRDICNDFNQDKICISIDVTQGFRGGSYLHLFSDTNKGTAGTNINPIFKEDENNITFIGLEVGPSKNSPSYVFTPLFFTFDELGLFEDDSKNEKEVNLQIFLDYFLEMRKAELMGALIYKGTKQLEETHNLILTGAPGTGKTYLAKKIAAQLILEQPNTSGSEKLAMNKQCDFVQFHPSYDYTDFVEGLRPIKDTSGNVGFERKDGVFKKFCEKALVDQNNKYVFIIDEINRGELSKIFGELFYSIDPGYRGKNGAVLTQYANMVVTPNKFDENISHCSEDSSSEERCYGHFFVPENVYIIGTMNDIDRSVESMDFAMRRRFSFMEIRASERIDMWTEDWKDLAKACMEAINDKIDKVSGLGPAYHIGPAYFKKLNNDKPDFFKLWDCHLYGVLFEYLRGKKDADRTINDIQNVYLKALVSALKKRFNDNGIYGSVLKAKKDSKTNDNDTKTYLNNIKNAIKWADLPFDNLERSQSIFKLSKKIEFYMELGKTIMNPSNKQ